MDISFGNALQKIFLLELWYQKETALL